MRYSKDNPPLGFYVYCYLREDLTPYYVGKGSETRAWRKHHKIKNGFFQGVKVPNDNKRIVIVEANLSEVGAFAIERRLIKWYGRKDKNNGILRNRTDGGEGGSGIITSEETRRRKSEANKGQGLGRKLSEETKQKMRGRTYTLEVRAKMGAPKGTVPTTETRLKISASKKGKPNIKNRGRKMSQDQIENRTNSRKSNGKPWFTEEHRLKISENTKRALAEKKAKKLAEKLEHFNTLFIIEAEG